MYVLFANSWYSNVVSGAFGIGSTFFNRFFPMLQDAHFTLTNLTQLITAKRNKKLEINYWVSFLA